MTIFVTVNHKPLIYLGCGVFRNGATVACKPLILLCNGCEGVSPPNPHTLPFLYKNGSFNTYFRKTL